uniref:Uncharacterized protein n=1 Tax=Plectus sambesii TaxID=2011161 RepID=A0A914WB71_9BILA
MISILSAFFMLIAVSFAAPAKENLIVRGGGMNTGLCDHVLCGSGQRCKEDWNTHKAICEAIPDEFSGNCNCQMLDSIPNHDQNTLSFTGNDCYQTVKCTRTHSQQYVYLGFKNFGSQVFRTHDYPNFAVMDVICGNDNEWTVNNKPFDAFDC